MSNPPTGLICGEIDSLARDLDVIGDILVALSHPDIDFQRSWARFFGSAIGDIVKRIDDVIGRLA